MTEPQQVPYTIARSPGVRTDGLLARARARKLQAALISTPDAFYVARITDAGFEVIERGAQAPSLADLSRAYEVRAFGHKAELRWTRAGDAGEAVLLADGHLADTDDSAPAFERTIDTLERSYRLWGEPPKTPVVTPSGWSALTTGRIGLLYVPFPGASSDGVVLKAKEYVVKGASGNAVVAFERLVGFAPAEPPTAQ
jgi:CRISPR-associated protein (TIGR03984 family)